MKRKMTKREREFVESGKIAIARMFAEGAIQEVKVMPIDLQLSILRKTDRYFKDPKFARDCKTVQRKYLNSAAKCLQTLVGQMERTKSTLENALVLIHAEQDARDIGTEPSDNVLVRDQKNRETRLERYRSRLQKGGK